MDYVIHVICGTPLEKKNNLVVLPDIVIFQISHSGARDLVVLNCLTALSVCSCMHAKELPGTCIQNIA